MIINPHWGTERTYDKMKNKDELELLRKWYKEHPDSTTVECSEGTGVAVKDIYNNRKKIHDFKLPTSKNITILGQEMKGGLMFKDLNDEFLSDKRLSVRKYGLEINDKYIGFAEPIEVEGVLFEERNSYIYFADNMLGNIHLTAKVDGQKNVKWRRREIHLNWLEAVFGKPNTGKPFSEYDFENIVVRNEWTLEYDYFIGIYFKQKRGRFIVKRED